MIHPNCITLISDIAEIDLGNQCKAVIDIEDLTLIRQHKWRCMSRSKRSLTDYAVTDYVAGSRTLSSMHRMILGVQKDEQVDHIDGNGLNNRRCNLRKCSAVNNQCNRDKPSRNKQWASQFKGVSLKDNGRWFAQIQVNKRHYHLGYFDTEVEAAQAYDKSAKTLHGEYARINFSDSAESA